MWESRVAPLSGVLFAAFLVASFLVDPNTDFMPPPADIVDYLSEAPGMVMFGAYLRLLAAGALLWFTGSLFTSLRFRDDDSGRLSMLAVGGGAAAAVLIAVGAAGVGAAAERLWVTDTIDAAGAAALVDLSSLVIGNAAALGLGVMIAATGLVLLRSQVEPRWAGVISVLVAIALISPYAWAALAATILWTPAASILIYRSASRAPSSEPTGIA